MCGIAGIYHYGRPESVDRAALEKMNACLIHRGPDDGGVYVDGPIGLAMRRLAIIDLTSGHQPMSSEDGSLWLVFNGEIYNFQELREELLKKGRHFKTTSDTEVILHLYAEMGPDCVKRLRGMFAFSLWDAKKKRLLLARDRLGKKPLLYTVANGRLSWASEMQALVSSPDVSRKINLRAVDLFLGLQYIPSPDTIFESVQKLPPGHILIHEGGQFHVKRYWDLPVDGQTHSIGLEEAKHGIREKLKEATRLRMISDVPLGAFLSGGIDSTVIVGLMSELSDRPIKTFSIGFEEQEFSELGYAREAAKKFGADHTEFVVKPEMADVLPLLAKHYGEPFGDSSALPSYYVARETRKHVTVALNGDGGDENFAGYSRYQAMKIMGSLDWIPRPVRKMLSSISAVLPVRTDRPSNFRKAKRFLGEVLAEDSLSRYLLVVGIFFEKQKRAMYSDGFTAKLNGDLSSASSYLQTYFDRSKGLDPVSQLLYVDLNTYLPECLMAKIDIATMANSLEGRSPLLDHEFVEYVFRIRSDWKLKGFQTKWILKETFKDMLPPSIQTRGKMGFGIPLGAWFRGQLKKFWADHVLSEAALRRGYFNRAYLQRMFDEHAAGKADHGYRMWNLLMLELWHEAYAPQSGVD